MTIISGKEFQYVANSSGLMYSVLLRLRGKLPTLSSFWTEKETFRVLVQESIQVMYQSIPSITFPSGNPGSIHQNFCH